MKRIGVEAIRLDEFGDRLQRQGQKILDYIFTESEKERCWKSSRSIKSFAGVLAAKEALLKVFPSFVEVAWRQIAELM